MMSQRSLYLVLIACFVLGGCSSWDWDKWPWTPEPPKKTRVFEWENVAPEPFPVIKAVGYAPLTGQMGDTPEQRMLMAMRASKIDAYRQLLEQVYGQEIENETTVRSWIGHSDEIRTRVSGIIRGAKVVKSYQVNDHYVVEMEIDFKQVWQLYRQLNPERRLKNVQYF